MVGATIAIAGLSMTVWAHHMFTTGAVLLPFFSFMTFLIAVPTGVKFFNWTGTIWRGQLTFDPPMLFPSGFLATFLLGGLTGVILASPPLDFAVSDSYFLVAHFHYVLFGTVVFTMFGGFYFWWPKFTGKKLNAALGTWHFWTLFIGFWMTFLVQHWLGAIGMPRRIARYPFLPDLATTLNIVSSIGAFILGTSTLIFLYNIYWTHKNAEPVTADDPWGFANSLEWATSCPPPRHNFTSIPRIRSERPAFDLHYPNIRPAGRPGGPACPPRTAPPPRPAAPTPTAKRPAGRSRGTAMAPGDRGRATATAWRRYRRTANKSTPSRRSIRLTGSLMTARPGQLSAGAASGIRASQGSASSGSSAHAP